MTEPCVTDDGVSFYLRDGVRNRHFVVSAQALRMLGRHHGFIMDYLNLYRAHEASIHIVARYLALKHLGDQSIRIDAPDFPMASQPGFVKRAPDTGHRH